MSQGTSGGNRKSSKRDQPKRRRYLASGRMAKHAIKNLERHMKKYSSDNQDKAADAALVRMRGW